MIINYMAKYSRFFNLSGVVAAAASVSGCNENKSLPDIIKPVSDVNFLIIMTDQQRWDTIKSAGNDRIHTPNLDRLVSHSTYFSQAVCPVPVSGPSRTCILTGCLMEKTGVTTNNEVDQNNCPFDSYDQILSENGYVTEYYGKFHSPMDMAYCYRNPSMYGLSGAQLIKKWSDLYRLYLKDKYVPETPGEKTLTCGFYANVPYVPNILDKRYEELHSGEYTDAELAKIPVSQPDCNGTLLLDGDLTSNAFHARQTLDAIDRLKGQRFALTCSFHSPHAPMLSLKEYEDKYDLSSLPIPASIGDNMVSNPYRNANGRPDNPEYADAEKVRYMVREYYAIITEIDYWIGKILDKLSELGLDRNTVVIFMSDHGEMLGAHGMREKNNFLEESVRVPLVIKDPYSASSPKEVKTPVSIMNVFQTIMDYAAIDIKRDGFSLRPVINGEEPNYDFAISEWSREAMNTPNLMIRTNDWKLILNTKKGDNSFDALYHLTDDPYEMNNLLYGSPSSDSRQKAAELTAKLMHYLEVRDYPYIGEVKAKLSQYE